LSTFKKISIFISVYIGFISAAIAYVVATEAGGGPKNAFMAPFLTGIIASMTIYAVVWLIGLLFDKR
jgi:hypothetical protein